jgi:predicted DNA-binding ribbon-helix-helix protein
MHRVPSRRIDIFGHQTGIRLEPEFWFWLRQIAAERGMSAKAYIESVWRSKSSRSLSSALRVAIAGYFHGNPSEIYRCPGRIVPTRDGGVHLVTFGRRKRRNDGSRKRPRAVSS